MVVNAHLVSNRLVEEFCEAGNLGVQFLGSNQVFRDAVPGKKNVSLESRQAKRVGEFAVGDLLLKIMDAEGPGRV